MVVAVMIPRERKNELNEVYDKSFSLDSVRVRTAGLNKIFVLSTMRHFFQRRVGQIFPV